MNWISVLIGTMEIKIYTISPVAINIQFEKDAIYIMDRGYLHFERLYAIHKQQAFFVVRSKQSLSFRRIYSHPFERSSGLRCDQTIILKHFYSQKDYPAKSLRNSTNFTGLSIWENPDKYIAFWVWSTYFWRPCSETLIFIGFLTQH